MRAPSQGKEPFALWGGAVDAAAVLREFLKEFQSSVSVALEKTADRYHRS